MTGFSSVRWRLFYFDDRNEYEQFIRMNTSNCFENLHKKKK